jgi:hypothetical protein
MSSRNPDSGLPDGPEDPSVSPAARLAAELLAANVRSGRVSWDDAYPDPA